MTTVYISSKDGFIGLAQRDEPATYAITDVPDYVAPRDILSSLAMYEPGRIPAGTITYRKLQHEFSLGIHGWRIA